MNYEIIKSAFIELQKEELNYINEVAKTSSNKILSEYEKLVIYRKINDYEIKLNEMLKKLTCEFKTSNYFKKNTSKDVCIEFDLPKDYLSHLNIDYEGKKYVLENLWIDPDLLKFKLTLSNLYNIRGKNIDFDIIQNHQRLIEEDVYIFCGYYDESENCLPCLKNPDDYLYGIYKSICNNRYNSERVLKKDMDNFEKDKIIIHTKRYANEYEIRKIFKEELLNYQNQSLNDCIIKTKNKIEELNYIKSPYYKEKVLLNKLNDLYKRVKGDIIKEEILYSGNFLKLLRETYKLVNGNIVSKEKVIKNNKKNSVIVIAITKDYEYIITIQNRIKDKLIAEFPSGYIEDMEDAIDASKRELNEEVGYTSDDLFIVDEVYTSPGIDNSKTFIVVANNCIKTDKKVVTTTEVVEYGLFSEKELHYLVDKNIMSGAISKLAYYNLINNVDSCNIFYKDSDKKIYKKLREKKDIVL